MAMRDFTLFEVILRNAGLYPHRPALIEDGRQVSHAEYLVRVERLAGGLAAAGVAPGDRVAVIALNNPAYFDLYGAAARLGAILVPVNWRLSADEVAHVLTDTAPKVIIAGTEYQDLVAGAGEGFAAAERCYVFGGAAGRFRPFAELTAADAVAPAVDVEADSGFLIVHTAAVGGRPRGALLSHAGCIAASMQMMQHWRLGPEDVNLGALPMFHLSGVGLFLAVQHAGGATVVLPKFDAEAALRRIRDDRVTVFAEFPPMLGTLLDRAQPGDLASLRAVTGLDSPETIARLEAACPEARFWAAYGQTEVSGLVSLAPFRDRPGAAGRPSFLCQVRVVDDFDQPVPTGSVGEIVVRGPMVFKGYWNCPTDNAFTFRNGWHHTGDHGRFDADGFLWYAGRAPTKELIKPGGENVYPAEVERVIREHPAIAEVAVIGVADAQWGEAIKAVCACQPDRRISADDLIAFVGDRIARYKRPKHVVFVDALPKTAEGAIDRSKVRQEHGSA